MRSERDNDDALGVVLMTSGTMPEIIDAAIHAAFHPVDFADAQAAVPQERL